MTKTFHKTSNRGKQVHVFADYGNRREYKYTIDIIKHDIVSAMQAIGDIDGDENCPTWVHPEAQRILTMFNGKTEIYELDSDNHEIEWENRWHATYESARRQCMREYC